MARRLPPLNALRAFEAAARHGSFTLAAEELHVTPAAISHQVKALEAQLGVPLFRRLTRGLVLTDAGRAYLPELTDGLDRLARATERLFGHGVSGTLTVSVLPSFATRWLVPRLSRFRERHPELDVTIHASTQRIDFRRDDVDLALRYGQGRYRGLHAELVLAEECFPVCSPALLAGPVPLRVPDDLRRHVLLHEGEPAADEFWITWEPWVELLGLTAFDWRRGPRFTDGNMLLQACLAGQGVAIGRSVLIADDLAAGRLVRPFEVSHPADFSYYLVCLPDAVEQPKVAAFRAWLLEEAAGGAAQGTVTEPGTEPGAACRRGPAVTP